MNALVLFKMDNWVTSEMTEQIRSKSLANVKQLICGPMRDQLIVDIAFSRTTDLNVALSELAGLPHVKNATVVHVTHES
jgi:hypothetical protein